MTGEPTTAAGAISPGSSAAGNGRGSASKPASVPLPHPTRRNWVWRFSQYLMYLFAAVTMRFRARGLHHIPAEGGGLVIVNHQSFLDPLMVGLPLRRPVSYLARDNLFRVPVVGWILRNTYVMPINREAASTASIREAVARMRHGFLVGIFPEGTRSDGRSVGPFKPGFLALLRRGKVPVYPVGVAGTGDAMPREKLRFRPRQVCVVFGEPIPVEEVERMAAQLPEEELVAEIRRRVVDCAEQAIAWKLELGGAGDAVAGK